MAYGDRTTCKACGREIVQIGGGHRQRLYCDDTCKQAAFRVRREQEHKDAIHRRWSSFTVETRGFLDWIMTRYGDDLATGIEAAINREKQQATIDPSEALMTIGRAWSFPRLDFVRWDGQMVYIHAGEKFWNSFSLNGECRDVKLALEAARKRNRPGD